MPLVSMLALCYLPDVGHAITLSRDLHNFWKVGKIEIVQTVGNF